jgi:hypothetical protein
VFPFDLFLHYSNSSLWSLQHPVDLLFTQTSWVYIPLLHHCVMAAGLCLSS